MSEAVVPPPGYLERMSRFSANAAWAHAHSAELKAHRGRFVAIDGEALLEVSDSREALTAKYKDRTGVYIAFVAEPGLDRIRTWDA